MTDNLLTDVRFGLRMLARSPGFTTAAIVCLALGIGATTAIFSIVNAVVLRPLPYRAPERLVRLYSEFPGFPGGGLRKFWLSGPEYLDLKRESKSWETLDGWVNGAANLSGKAEPLRVTVSYVTGTMLPTLGVQPLLGRWITPQDDIDGKPIVADISYGLWQRAFGGDHAIIGRETLADGVKCTIIGVMPSGFQFPPGEADAPELWTALQLNPASPGGRGSHYLSLLGRLKDGVSDNRAKDETAQLVRQWGAQVAPASHSLDPKQHPIVSYSLHEEVVGAVRPAMLMLLVAVGFVLLIACVNVANLLLARAEARQREIAIRKALGAGMGRLLRQFITEGMVLSLAGASLGSLLAWGGLQLVKATSAGAIPRVDEVGIHPYVFAFTLLVSVATGLFFGLAPVAQLTLQNVHEALKAAASRNTSSAGANHFRRALVAGELALALVLLIGAGLMVQAFWKLQQVNIGLDARNLLTLRVSLPDAIYTSAEKQLSFWARAQEQLSRLPGVQSAALSTGLPPERRVNANDTSIEGFVRVPGGPIQNVDFWHTASARYFETMRIPLIEGRYLDERDGAGSPPVAVVNQTMARRFWGKQSPIGRRIKTGDPWRTVVGVVADVKNAGLDQPIGTELYVPASQFSAGGIGLGNASIVLRTAGDPMTLASAARRQLHEIDSSLPVNGVRSMEDVIYAAQSRPRFLTMLLTIFSSVALILAAVGIYGVISYSVARRTSEFGIRMAMGAQPVSVLFMVLRQGMTLGIAGVAAGILGALALTRLIRGLLFGVDATDPVTFAAMASGLLVVTLLACYIPARRATKVDPMVALRYE